MPAVEGVSVRGLRDLNRAFAKASKQARKDMREIVAQIARPVQLEAQRLAVTEISGLRRENETSGSQWAYMRIGVTQRLLYVAPQQRGRLTKRNKYRYARPNMAKLLMEKAMEPALESKRHLIEHDVEVALDRLADHFNQGA